MASAPPATQPPRMRNGVCPCLATTLGFMKIPDPTIPPITSMVASNTPSCRRTLVSSKAVGYHTPNPVIPAPGESETQALGPPVATLKIENAGILSLRRPTAARLPLLPQTRQAAGTEFRHFLSSV